MHWFLIALVSPALWAVSNHLDKLLISRYFKSGADGAGALIIFSSVIGFFVFPFIPLVQSDVWTISLLQIGIVFLDSIFFLFATLIYLWALKKDEASIVVPLFQTIPIFGFILGYLFLGETITVSQVIACSLIILGGVSISLNLRGERLGFKARMFFLILLSSFFYAASGVIFKIIALQTDYWTTNFWGYMGQALIGVFLFACIKNYRLEFLKILKENKAVVIGLNGLNEGITVLASLAVTFALLLAPVVLVQAVNGFQPFFVLLFGIILTLFFPRLGTESLLKKQLAQKIIAIAVMLVGTYILNT